MSANTEVELRVQVLPGFECASQLKPLNLFDVGLQFIEVNQGVRGGNVVLVIRCGSNCFCHYSNYVLLDQIVIGRNANLN